MVEFLESGDANGHGISIGGGGMTVIGGGESANEIIKYYTNNRTIKNGGAEKMIIGNDENIDFFTNCQAVCQCQTYNDEQRWNDYSRRL